MKRGILFVLILISAVSLLILFDTPNTQADTETPPIIINELTWAGSSSSNQDEWIELKNTTSEDIDLTGWQITKDTSGDGSNEVLMLEIINDIDNPQNTIIPAEGYFLIAHNAQDYNFGDGEIEELSVLNIEPDYIDSSITLSNSNLSIKLYNELWDEGGELIDTAGDGSTPLAGDNDTKTSMEKNEIYAPGNLPDSWHEATVAINLDEGVIDKATPKSANSSAQLPPPEIYSISPVEALVDTILEIEEIAGENFSVEDEIQIQIRQDAISITATNVHVASSTIVDSARFDLSGAVTGNWDLVVINPDEQEGVLVNALNITELEEEIIYSNDIIISELYPKPETSSNDEFIELYNTGSNSVNLKDWKLDDQYPGGSGEYTINSDLIIEAGQYLSFDKPQIHISLNDTGDYVRLIQPDNNVLDETPNYGSAKKGYSYSLLNDQWQWSLRVTKNQVNILELPEEEEEDETEIELSLDFDELESTSALLIWTINVSNKINNVAIYQSKQEEKLGQLIVTISAKDEEYLIENLEPNTKYFFTITGIYQSSLIESNQIEIITLEEILNNIGYAKQIIITEILPNPATGQDEFIELYNPTEEMVNIAGWRLVDASSRSYTINSLDLPPITITTLQTGSVIIGPGQYALLEQSVTSLHLNNSGGEELYLLDTDDNIIDSVTYTGSAERSYVYVLAPNNHWFWSDEMTPGEANDISFAGITGDATDYLTASGTGYKLGWMSLISLVLSVIMFILIKRYGHTNYK